MKDVPWSLRVLVNRALDNNNLEVLMLCLKFWGVLSWASDRKGLGDMASAGKYGKAR